MKSWDNLKLVIDKRQKYLDFSSFKNTMFILRQVRLDDDEQLHKCFRDSIKRFEKVLRIDMGLNKSNKDRLRILIVHMTRKGLLSKEQVIRIVLF